MKRQQVFHDARSRSILRRPVGLVLLITSCAPSSLLITPVASRRTLVETELSRDTLLAWPKIALIDVSGTLMNAHTPQLLGEGEQPVSLFVEQLDKARRDPAVKAVILRINSPGGTVVASELMHDELMYFKKKTGKKVVAVMMDVAASGAYYLACACDEIVAQSSTVTGSIGVIMHTFDLSGTLNLIGVKSTAITSGDKKDIGSPFKAMTEEEKRIFQDIINDMYEQFVQVVVAGRPQLDEDRVRRLADGRVYTAHQALEAGLIDRIAPMREVIQSLKTKLDVSSVRVVAYHRPLGYKPNYYARVEPTAVDRNWLQLKMSTPPFPTSPRFMYLWAP